MPTRNIDASLEALLAEAAAAAPEGGNLESSAGAFFNALVDFLARKTDFFDGISAEEMCRRRRHMRTTKMTDERTTKRRQCGLLPKLADNAMDTEAKKMKLNREGALVLADSDGQQQLPQAKFQSYYAKAIELLMAVEVQTEAFDALRRENEAFLSESIRRSFHTALTALNALHIESLALTRKFADVQRQHPFNSEKEKQQRLLLDSVYRRRRLANETLAEALAFFTRPQLVQLPLRVGSRYLHRLIAGHFGERAPYRLVRRVELEYNALEIRVILSDLGRDVYLPCKDAAGALAHLRPRWVRCESTDIYLSATDDDDAAMVTEEEEEETRFLERARALRHLWAPMAGGGGGSLCLHFKMALTQRRFDATMRALVGSAESGGGAGVGDRLSVTLNECARPRQLTIPPTTLDLRTLYGRCTSFSLYCFTDRAFLLDIGGGGNDATAEAIVDFAQRCQSPTTTADHTAAAPHKRISIRLYAVNVTLAEAIVRVAEERFRRNRTHRCSYAISLWTRHNLAPEPARHDVRVVRNAVTNECVHVERLVALNVNADAKVRLKRYRNACTVNAGVAAHANDQDAA